MKKQTRNYTEINLEINKRIEKFNKQKTKKEKNEN